MTDTQITEPQMPPSLWEVDEMLMGVRVALYREGVAQALTIALEVVDALDGMLTEAAQASPEARQPCALPPVPAA